MHSFKDPEKERIMHKSNKLSISRVSCMNFLAVNDSCAVQESAVKEENEIDTLIERYYEALQYHKIGDEAAAIDCYEEICSSSLSEKEIEVCSS